MDEFLETAEYLGAKLIREAIWDGNRCNWFGLPASTLGSSRTVIEYRMSGVEFQYGTSGIAFFLAHLYAATGEEVFRTTCEGAIRQALSRLDDIHTSQRLSFRNGLVGIAYALLDLSRTCEIEKYTSIALFILEEACKTDSLSESTEIDSESISALLSIYRAHPNEFILQTAIGLGERPWAGAVALLDLFSQTRDVRFKERAEVQLSLMLYEKLKLARANLKAFEFLKADDYLAKAKSTVNEISQSLDRSMNFSFASGLAYQADILIEAAHVFDNSDYLNAARKIGNFGIDRYRKDNLPWPCSSPDKSETPGLMNGLAGIGYIYLRLFDSLKNPSLMC